MAIPIITDWKSYFLNENEGLGSSYERIVINNYLTRICREYKLNRILEAPLFGFTGLSGVNSMNLARQGMEVVLLDNNSERLVLIEKKWQECKMPVELKYSENFTFLPFADKEFDLSWNFSALWFVEDLQAFLAEIDRITSKAVLIMVPNRTGIGFVLQQLLSGDKYRKYVRPEWIKARTFSKIMKDLGWKLSEKSLIDSPPWPDIGMKKQLLAKKLSLGFLLDNHSEQQRNLTIMDYYRGSDKEFPEKMMRYNFLEKNLPALFKLFWAHHHYYLFLKGE